MPSHTSPPPATQKYSQPLPGRPSLSEKFGLHPPVPRAPPVQTGAALGKLHTLPQVPQLLTSVLLSMPSSVVPSQSSSWPLQKSGPRNVHAYSHPSPAVPFRSTNPGEQTSI